MVKHAYDVGALSWLPDGRSFVSGGLDTNVLFWVRPLCFFPPSHQTLKTN
jgi:hypothetical protein